MTLPGAPATGAPGAAIAAVTEGAAAVAMAAITAATTAATAVPTAAVTAAASTPLPVQPFFLPAADGGQAGARYCLYYPPAGACRAALVYLHPFAEEMNRSRRMAALAARALAAQGVAVLQIDLLGCGDSSGDFGDADWEAWRADVARAVAWLRARSGCPVGLWGLRLGALLALDCAEDVQADHLLLWQPVHSGAQFLTQFLRLQLASDMLEQPSASGAPGKVTTGDLRAALRTAPLEVAGYLLSPAMADALERVDIKALAPACPVHWLELVAEAGRPMSPAAHALAQAWQAQGMVLTVQTVASPPFWSAAEIATSPALLDATTAIYAGAGHAA